MANFYGPDPLQSTFFIPGSNTPGNGVQLFIYLAGSTTKTTVYKTQAGTAHTNPIVLDSGGNLPSQSSIWIPAGVTIKAVYAPSNDSDPPVSPYLTIDNISGINDVAATASQWVTGPTPTFVSPTQFTLVGDQTSTFQIGRRVQFTATAGTGYGTITASVFGASTTVTIIPDTIPLDSGLSAVNYALLSATNPSVPLIDIFPVDACGRLTASSATPITTVDVTSATLFFTPYKGNTIQLYNGTYWNRFNFVETSISVPNTSNTVYDVFAFAVSSAVQLSTAVWSTVSTRTADLATQNGVLVRTGDTSQRYIGTFSTADTAGTTADTLRKRYVWNMYNRALRPVQVMVTTGSWVNSSATHPAEYNTSNRFDFARGLDEDAVSLVLKALYINGTSDSVTFVGFGLDNTTSFTLSGYGILATNSSQPTTLRLPVTANFNGYTGIGKHFLQWIENAPNTTGVTALGVGLSTGVFGTTWG